MVVGPREKVARGGLPVYEAPGDRCRMPNLNCHTCDLDDQQHDALTRRQEEWLKSRLVTKNVDGYVMCARASCRHVRNTWTQCAGTGDRHIRIPYDVN
jgi:hypothetical protein